MSEAARAGVLLDRDGVINREVGGVTAPAQLRLLRGAARGIALLNASGLPVVVVTNQAIVARGRCDESTVRRIHARLIRMLASRGARLDSVQYCPHHPDADLPRYRRRCGCRKPGTAMLRRAARELALDLDKSFVIGDRTVDIKAGIAAGCRTVLVETGYGGGDHIHAVRPTTRCADLEHAARWVVEQVERDRHQYRKSDGRRG